MNVITIQEAIDKNLKTKRLMLTTTLIPDH